MVLEPIYEHRFAQHSYGFRPERSCRDALRRVDGQLAEGHTHVVDIDIQGYFDTIDQERLMQLLKEDVSDGPLLEVNGKAACARSTESDNEDVDAVEITTMFSGRIGTLPSLDCLVWKQPNAKPSASVKE